MTWMMVLSSYFLPAVVLLAMILWDWAQAAGGQKLVRVMPHRLDDHQEVRRRLSSRRWAVGGRRYR
jgi:hypothetical protein